MRAKKIIVTLFLACLLSLPTTVAYANGILPLPHAFYGSVTINDNPAPVGTRIEARGEGVLTGFDGNPITTTEQGTYGSADPLEPRLIVQGDIAEGTTSTFYVNGHSTGQTAEWHSGETTELDLTVSIPTGGAGDGGPGAGPAAAPAYIDTSLSGEEDRYLIGDDGEILETIEATSADGDLTIIIPEGTIALDEDGDPLGSLEITVDDNPPEPPEDAHIIGLAYDFEPNGATFDPPITLVFTYDPDDITEGVAEEDLVIAYYDEDAGEWVELDSEVDPETNTITALVDHFTTFSVLAYTPSPPRLLPASFAPSALSISPIEAEIGESVNISALVTNTGEKNGSYTLTLKLNGAVEEEQQITLAGGSEDTVTFVVTLSTAGTYSVDVNGLVGSFTVGEEEVPGTEPVSPPPTPTPASPINWAILGPIIGIAIFLAIFLPLRRRRRS